VAAQLSKETLDLVSALRPFTGQRGRNLIDALIDLAEGETTGVEGLEISNLAEKARGLLASTVDSAVSLFLILVIIWLAQFVASAEPKTPGDGQVRREVR